jgi:thiamine biosynthesis protein ThiS
MTDINVIVNGKPRTTSEGTSLLELLTTLELDPAAVVVELNRRIVRPPDLGEHTVHEGDQVELVHFVGGG